MKKFTESNLEKNIIIREYDYCKTYIFLPKSYASREEEYPVFYYNSSLEINTKEIDISKNLELNYIFVYIFVKESTKYFSPWYKTAINKKYPDFLGEGESYLEDLFKSIIFGIEKDFRIKDGRESTCIGGYSLGGLISSYSITKYDYFGYLVSNSSSFWYPDFTSYFDVSSIGDKTKVVIICGTEEGKHHGNILEEMVPNTEKIMQILQRKIKYKNLSINWLEGNHHKNRLERFICSLNWFNMQIK